MNLDELEHVLNEYTEVEKYNKMKYEGSHYKAWYNYAWEYTDKKTPLPPSAYEDIQQFFIMTGLTDVFPEQYYFKGGRSVTLVKHDRYAYPFVHKHNFYEIVYCLSGEFVHEIEGEEKLQKAGEIYFIAPGISHSLKVFNDSIVLNLLVKNSDFDMLFRPMIGKDNVLSDFFTSTLYSRDQKCCLYFDTAQDEKIRGDFLAMISEEYENLPYNGEVLSHQVMLLFYDLLRHFSGTAQSFSFHKESNDKFNEVIVYIRDHFATVTLDDLTNQFYFNKSYLSRLIKEKTGQTFSDLVKGIRLEIAAQLIANTTLSLREIAQAVGYADTSHLFRIFKKHYGIGPKEYRQRLQNP